MANRKNNTSISQRAAVIQSFFNKLNVSKIQDLSSVREESTENYFGSTHSSLESVVAIDQHRIQRYREYDQMCYVPELNGGLELYADDASLYNSDDEVIESLSENNEVSNNLEDLWYRALDMNANLWHIVYNTCKYGDAFYELIPDDYKNPKRIKYMRYIPPYYVTREELDGNLLQFIVKIPAEDTRSANYSFYSNDDNSEEVNLKPWQIVHFKLDDKEFEPYGKSVLESGRLAFKQMKLIEDAMLIYRITRAPERRIFGIPVGNLPYREAMRKVEDFKQRYRKTPWIDPLTGEINYKSNPLSINDDFFLPRRPDGSGPTVDTLPGGQQLGEIDDVRYFKEKILRTMRIPLAYLTGEMQGDVAKTSLSAMDVRFAKTIERIQKMIIKGLEKIAIIELAFKRFTIDDLHDFKLNLTIPSKIYEMQELEIFNQKLTTIQSALALIDTESNRLFLPKEWLYKKVMKFNDEEISEIKLMQLAEIAEKEEDKNRQNVGGAEGEAGGLGGGMPGAGGFGGGMTQGGEMGATQGSEIGGEEIPGGEMGGQESPAPEAPAGPAVTGGQAGLELASKIFKIAGKEFLLENERNIKDLLKFVMEFKETQKLSKDNLRKKPQRKLYENSFNLLFIQGELKGLIRRTNKKMLKED